MSSPPRHVKSAGAFEAGATAWTQTYQYDGFGNLTAKVLNGTSTPIAVNAATNQLTYAYYDGNGNMTSGAGASLTYDVANRLATVNSVSGGLESFQYAPDNKRIVRVLPDGSQELTFYGGRGERLGVFWVEPPDAYNPNYSFTPRGMTLWFGGRIVEDFNNGSAYYENQTAPLVQDRLGTNRTNGARYRPYGEEITSTANDQIKFATYTRDSYSGLDYADQRFYASTYGRFNTPDPSVAGGAKKGSVSNPGDPGSWNRYAYTRGDPVNRFDPRGTEDCAAVFADASQPYDPYSSCSGAQGNCPNMTAFAGDPDDPTFEAQAAAMGCYGAPVVPVAAPATPSLTFSVSLYERPVYVNGIYVGEHTYIDATGQLGTGAYVNFLCQGGPSGPNGTGNLVGSCQSGYNTMVNVPPSGPGLSANIQVGGTYSCNNCGVVTQLLASVDLYSQSGNLAAYSGTMNGGYNSNSYAFTLLEDIGLAGYTSSGSAWSWFGTPWLAPGWGVTVPGLGP